MGSLMSNHSQPQTAIWATDSAAELAQHPLMARGGKATGKGNGPPYLAEWREFRGLTIQELADAVHDRKDADKTWVSKRENRRVNITVEDLVKISRVLKCELYELFFPPSEEFKRALTMPVYANGQSGSGRPVLEGNMIPKDHIALCSLVLSLPTEAIPVVGALILKMAAVTGTAKPGPQDGETAA
jgi:hypothetical protein